ncbi:cytochrome aa3 quinol oxidase subunit III [Halobacillus sp. ACCC02827]|uniref:cytochrome aa3 quinol oxidase subunit III n=1 Tax=Bacillaceae TaxID=186817 RepID=UPI0002A50721|nr:MULTISPECIES: cytochrome aa3 quinol oxidase subunit III [Bacillaceae]ELK46029.1 cytochrome aa3 quinol oxidase subunit III [Halobacillus sp. BAB-2008]QHT46254.1 cytochrome aa3 quinol oxidase subunit III [Bacillus sp. SB49]WJE17074.1 cytochrome aa3 quinol oxidase subunit III [Halobacillus sp. ACCC02827]
MAAEELKTGPLEYRTQEGQMSILGFWIFLGAEVVLFSTLFATYAVLFGRTADAPTPGELFEPGIVLIMTFLLLVSSFTCGLAIHQMRKGNVKGMTLWMIITLALGLGFLGFEIFEFFHYTHEGATLQSAAFWSAFFVLAGTHGLHVTLGIGWAIGLLIQLRKRGLTTKTSRKFFIVSLYWHFLDVVWIFIFTAVYLIGMVV